MTSTWRRQLESWSIPAQFQDFGTGVISLSGLFYFVALAVGMLYLNMVLLGRRHWAGGEASSRHWIHSAVRFVAVVLALVSFTVMLEQLGIQKGRDFAAEQLHTLSTESTDMIKNMSADRPVLVQVYYSPEVPRDFVEVKADLLGLLKEYDARSGGKIRLSLVPTELYSTEARRTRRSGFGIEPRRVFSDEGGKQSSTEVFLGVAFTSGVEEARHPRSSIAACPSSTRAHAVDSRRIKKRAGRRWAS